MVECDSLLMINDRRFSLGYLSLVFAEETLKDDVFKTVLQQSIGTLMTSSFQIFINFFYLPIALNNGVINMFSLVEVWKHARPVRARPVLHLH